MSARFLNFANAIIVLIIGKIMLPARNIILGPMSIMKERMKKIIEIP
jgi:hypothetical protein